MPIVITSQQHGTHPSRALFRPFHPTAEFTGGIPAPTLACRVAIVSKESQGIRR